MAAYLSGSSVKGDSIQTLYLMNPSYAAYNDPSTSSNMVLLSPTAANQDLLGNPGQQQQQEYAGFSLPQTVPQQAQSAQEIYANRVSNQGYSWNGGNELLFLPASDIRGDNQSLSVRLNSLNTGQNLASSIMSHLDTANLSESSFHEQVPFLPSGMAVGMSTHSLQTSTGAGQILSLSLSPQQPSLNQLQCFPIQHPELAVNGGGSGLNNSILENFSHKGNQWMGNNLNSLRTSPSILGSGFQGQLTGLANNRQANAFSGSLKIELYNSKYLKPVQQLLNEVVSVERVSKSCSVNQAKPQPWATPNSSGSGYCQEKNPTRTGSKDGGAVVNWGSGEGMLNVSPLSTAVSESQDQNVENLVELTAAVRQELQIKKAKLLAMVDEVDQRYRQYHHQMQMVVASFETTAGLGAAQTYTALALQTISKHFRCLKDAIRDQIQVASRVLGEEVETRHGRGEISRLRFIDQQLLRQQRALQQLGMMPQHPWRPQRGLPERSVSVLRAWLFEHFLHPYPKDSDKVLLARQTGLTRNQVSNWFINARVRLWKPMVEEMYAEEMKDEEDAEGADKPNDRADDEGTGILDVGRQNVPDRPSKQGNVSNFKSESFLGVREAADEQDKSLIHDKILANSLSDSLLPERQGINQALKRARNDLTAGLKTRPYNLHSGHAIAKPGTDDAFGIPSEGLLQDDEQNLGSYGVLNFSRLNRYTDDGLAATYPNSKAVSLTLGLQHSEGLSVSAVQQGYGQSQLHTMGGRPEGEMTAINFYGMHDISGRHKGNVEVMNLQGRKQFTNNMLQQDFT